MTNKYLKTYIKIVKKYLDFPSNDLYVEKHHIFPKCLFGNNNKIVILSARVHYLLHLLLWKGCEVRYGKNHNNTIKCFHAFWNMNIHLQDKRQYINSHFYERCKVLKSEQMKVNNPMFDEKSKEKLKASKKGQGRGRIVLQETRDKISNSLTGISFNEERKSNISKGLHKVQKKKYSKWYKFTLPSGEEIIEFNTKTELSKKYNIPKTTLLRRIIELE